MLPSMLRDMLLCLKRGQRLHVDLGGEANPLRDMKMDSDPCFKGGLAGAGQVPDRAKEPVH